MPESLFVEFPIQYTVMSKIASADIFFIYLKPPIPFVKNKLTNKIIKKSNWTNVGTRKICAGSASDYVFVENCAIMSAKEKEAAAKQTFTFLAPLTNEQPCEAGRDSA